MYLNLDNNRLRKIIPNIIHEVEGETPLCDKLRPWLDSAKAWLEDNVLGHDIEPAGGALPEYVESTIVHKAFADAVPSLDVTVSPAGFAVINTDGRAPASKERVERLIASLNAHVDDRLIHIVRMMAYNGEWRCSPMGEWWLATFIPNLDDAGRFRLEALPKADLLTTYRAMRYLAMRFEQELAELYLGRSFLSSLRSAFPAFQDKGVKDIYQMIHAAELRFISRHIHNLEAKCPDGDEVWLLARPIIAQLNYWPALKESWENEMGGNFIVSPFKNTVKGGFYF